jgi:hypothetical protein
MEEKTKQRIKKLQALAERGVGGEKDTAEKMLQKLLKKNGISTLAELEEDKKRHTLCISDGCLEEIGEYESKERCLEILDEIEKICGQYLYAEGSAGLIRGTTAMPPMAAVIPRLYQMPEK